LESFQLLTVALSNDRFTGYIPRLGSTSYIIELNTAHVRCEGGEGLNDCLESPALPMTLHILLGIGIWHYRFGRATEVRKECLAIIIEILIVGIQLQSMWSCPAAHHLQFDLKNKDINIQNKQKGNIK